MIVYMVSALHRAVACLTLLLPFETMASERATRTSVGETTQIATHGECGRRCVEQPPAQPNWQEMLEQFGLLLPKIPQMPSACRPVRQYRTVSLDRKPRPPCLFA